MFDLPHKTVASFVLGLACLAVPCASRAAAPVKLSGSITGMVFNPAGTPQMGATVLLYNRQDRVCEKALTDERGEFKFLGLFPDLYSIRVTLAAFVPAFRNRIMVQPGMRSMVAVNLSTLFSSVQLMYPPIENGSLMTDDWKWMLRGSMATRPVMRFAGQGIGQPPAPRSHADVFSDTRGILRVSAADGPPAFGIANEADLGTAFALATSLYGNNFLEVSGNLGYGSQTGVPMAAFRTSYSRRANGSGPEVSVTMRQLYLPGRMGAAVLGSDVSLPMLRSLVAGFDDRTEITDQVSLQYGFTMDSVSFLDTLNYASPYARLTYAPGDGSELSFTYTSGDARSDLDGGASEDLGLQRGLSTLGLFPRISVRGGRPRIQRGEEWEMAYGRRIGSRRYEVSAFRESVTNAALSLVAPANMYSGGDILPDLFSGNSIFNAGDYRTTGYTASVTQSFGEYLNATLMYGSMGALTAEDREIVSHNPDELRSMIRTGRKRAATARVAATIPGAGTHLSASYQWTDHRWAMPGHIYSTQAVRPLPGLNIYVRQPIPGLSFRPCRVEFTADLRNMLAQGYLPLGTVDGQQVLLVQTPRSVRGGLNFIF